MLLRMMASFLSMLSLLLLYLLIGLSNGQLTTCNVRPNPFGISTPTTGQALGITFYIDINNPFTCYGVITKWRLCYKRSAGALSDTIRIGIYEPTDNGNQFVKRGSNSIHLQLQHSDCLNITANPQLVVREGYVLAFYATVAYIKFYDDTTNGYLYKSVAFPNSISRGVLIKTSNPYAPKLGAYIDPIDPSTTSTTLTSTGNSSNIIPSSDATNDTSNTMSGSISVIITPTPTSESGIPPPDLLSDQCLVGVNEAFVHSFEIKHTPYLSTHLPSQCNGLIERWELCYKHINELAEIQLGIWRPNNTNYVLVGYDDITVVPKYLHSLINPLVCTVVTSSDALLYIEEGDLIGFNSTDLSVAFTNRNINKRSTDNDFIPLIRAITRIQPDELSSSFIDSYTPMTTPSPTHSLSPPLPPPSGVETNQSYLGIALGAVSSVLVIVLVILVLSAVGYFVRKRIVHVAESRTNLVSNQRDDLMYNVQYVPQNPQQVIISNRRHSLGFKKNPSYASSSITDLGELPQDPPPFSASPHSKLEHVYESI